MIDFREYCFLFVRVGWVFIELVSGYIVIVFIYIDLGDSEFGF